MKVEEGFGTATATATEILHVPFSVRFCSKAMMIRSWNTNLSGIIMYRVNIIYTIGILYNFSLKISISIQCRNIIVDFEHVSPEESASLREEHFDESESTVAVRSPSYIFLSLLHPKDMKLETLVEQNFTEHDHQLSQLSHPHSLKLCDMTPIDTEPTWLNQAFR